MAEQAYAYVTLIPVAKGFQRAVAKELDGVGGAGSKAGDVTGKNFSEGFGGQLKKLGILAAGALATAGVGRLLGDSIKQASDLGESLNAVNVVFEESAAGIAKIGESASKNLGLSQTEFNAAAVQFSSFAEKIAGDGGDVVSTINELTTRGADFASVMNLEVSEALQVFQSGLAGETEPLKKFGIDLSAASVEAYALEAGIISAGESMTETQKVQARYGALLEQTAKTSGDFANTSDSLANQQRILNAEFANVQASIGVALIPVLEKLQGIVIDKVLPAFEDFGDWLESPAGTAAVEGLTDVITGLVEFTIDLVGAIGTALPILAALGTAFIVMQGKVILAHTAIGIATVAQLGLNAAMAANPIGLVITALAGLAIGVGAFINATKEATPTQEELNDEIARATEELEFYKEAQDNSTNSSKLYESTINDLEAELRELRAAQQDSYNWTEAQTDASYAARDAAIAQRFAVEGVTGATQVAEAINTGYTESIDDYIAKRALFRGTSDNLAEGLGNVAQQAALAALGISQLSLVDQARAIQAEEIARIQLYGGQASDARSFTEILTALSAQQQYGNKLFEIAQDEIDAYAGRLGYAVQTTSSATTATTGATTATRSYTTALDEQGAALDRAIPANQEFLDVINGVAEVDLGPSIQDATRDIQNMIIELDRANELTRLPGGFVEFMQGGANVRALFDPETGELLESFTDADLPDAVAVTGDVIDLNVLNDELLRGEYSGAIQDLAGGAQNALDAILGQVTLTNPETGMQRTIGGTGDLTRAIEEAQADGYVDSGKFEGDVNDLIGAIDDAAQKIGNSVFPDAQLATGGLATKPTRALIGEAGPEMVIPLNKFESMMDMGGGKTLVYQAAPNQSMDSEQELFTAMRRAKVVANW